MKHKALKVVALMGVVFLVLLVLSRITGCAVGRGSAGEVVVGIDAGRLAETTEHGLTALGDYVLPGLGAVLAGIGVPAIGWARSYAAARAERAGRAAADAAWDESAARTAASVGVDRGAVGMDRRSDARSVEGGV